MNQYVSPNPDDINDSIFGSSTMPQESPLSSTSEGEDIVYRPSAPAAVREASHAHYWIEVDEGHPDGHLTSFCAECGHGITYYPTTHGIEDGKLINR